MEAAGYFIISQATLVGMSIALFIASSSTTLKYGTWHMLYLAVAILLSGLVILLSAWTILGLRSLWFGIPIVLVAPMLVPVILKSLRVPDPS